MLGIFCWMSRLGRPVEVHSDQIETFIENSWYYTMWEIADILKIVRSSLENGWHQLGYVNCFDVWVLHKWKKPSWCCSLLGHSENVSVFKTNCDKQWKVDTVQSGGMEEIVGQESWSTTSQTPVFIQRKWCCIYGGIGKQLSNKSSLWGTKWLISINIATN